MAGHIFLIGFMGAGKTSVAQALSGACHLRLMEMDEEIEKREERPISRIFEEDGEPYFRDLETRLLKELGTAEQRTVISCGGGVPLRRENVSLMRGSGTVVFLSAGPETIYARVKDAHTRPLLEEDMSIKHIRELLLQRLPAYQAAADLTVPTDHRSVEEICADILSQIG